MSTFRGLLRGSLLATPLLTPACDGKDNTDAPAESAAEAGDARSGTPPSAEASEALPDGDSALAHRLVEEGAVLLDVRSPGEYAGGHVEGAVNIPHDRVADELPRIGELTGGDKTKAIVVYCRSGRRSGLAKQTLAEQGYDRVSNLGAMSNW